MYDKAFLMPCAISYYTYSCKAEWNMKFQFFTMWHFFHQQPPAKKGPKLKKMKYQHDLAISSVCSSSSLLTAPVDFIQYSLSKMLYLYLSDSRESRHFNQVSIQSLVLYLGINMRYRVLFSEFLVLLYSTNVCFKVAFPQ